MVIEFEEQKLEKETVTPFLRIGSSSGSSRSSSGGGGGGGGGDA